MTYFQMEKKTCRKIKQTAVQTCLVRSFQWTLKWVLIQLNISIIHLSAIFLLFDTYYKTFRWLYLYQNIVIYIYIYMCTCDEYLCYNYNHFMLWLRRVVTYSITISKFDNSVLWRVGNLYFICRIVHILLFIIIIIFFI